ncbi:sigma-70 family RNA polymerase sigma factor [Staphylococcus hyicus]|nr:sigma-70 family RNA polymerase sigma factor [Staphylococcus hyicus]NJI31687.1 sigma-70 family RNA polymerase sigma factor [Staphylococcus hyicus]PTJ71996.1 sigma-70 family RNA polymerase sigma factor [Staphylococcus hyicus]PTJ87174.1 sigma-70 family RNA polymerase sigma factor [Staphylococcus hyicus]
MTYLTGQSMARRQFMNFETLYVKYEKFLHYLLKKYNISYNYDEYFQMLFIRLWELQCNYDAERSKDFHRYIRTKLHFYLIDLLRQHWRHPTTTEISNLNISVIPSYFYLQLSLISNHLSPQQWTWLTLHLNGYNQSEIQNKMQCSLSTVKNYKKQTLAILKSHLEYQ